MAERFVGPVQDVTVAECACLSVDVYDEPHLPGGWSRLWSNGAGDKVGGFFGAVYSRENLAVVALRGTSDSTELETRREYGSG